MASATGFCRNCNLNVRVNLKDVGIGSYEFWGAKGSQTAWIGYCFECEELVDNWDFEDNPEELSYHLEYPEDDWRENR